MQINISVLSVDKLSKQTAKGNTYFQLDVAYKDLGSGKVESRKIMPFGDTSTTHKVLSDAKRGDSFTIVSEKRPGSDGKEYWTWLSASAVAPGTAVPTQQTAAQLSTPTFQQTASTGSYKYQGADKEERAQTQVYIVRQSALAQAVATLAAGAKSPPAKENVLALAQEYIDFVFQKPKQLSLFDQPDDLGDVPL